MDVRMGVGSRININVSREALAALRLLSTPRKRGELISKLLIEEFNRQQCEGEQVAEDARRVAGCVECR